MDTLNPILPANRVDRASPVADRSLAARQLADCIRLEEETQGHPAPTPDADAVAIRGGGDFWQRVVRRAAALPQAPTRRQQLAALRASLRAVTLVVLLLAAVSGTAVASTALAAHRPASLPLVLIAVVGINLLSLLLWLLLQLSGWRVGAGMQAGSSLHRIGAWLAARAAPGLYLDDIALRVVAGGAQGRWFAATLVHGAWLAFALSAFLTLAILLSLRAYALSWETTLLDAHALATWADTLSWAPALLGAPSTSHLPLIPVGDADAHRGWAAWLLVAVFAYGVVPRLLMLALSAAALWRAQARVGRDAQAPGYARLRARLLPDHRALGIVDAAPPASPPADAAPPVASTALRGPVAALSLEHDGDDRSLPTLADVRWQWLGSIDDVGALERMTTALRQRPPDQLAILLRATATPDRGLERGIAALAHSVDGRAAVLLLDGPRLQARGDDIAAQRLADWRALAMRAGARLGVTVAPPLDPATRSPTGSAP